MMAGRRRRRRRGRRATAASDGLVVAVFSPKGGVGRTTLAVNLAVAAATELGKTVVLVDGSFQFGDVGVLLNLNPKNKSIADLVPELEAGEPESIDTFVINHSAGHPGPARPALAGDGRADHADAASSGSSRRCASTHDLVIVDCTSCFNDTTLAILDAADIILTMLSLEITSIKNMRLFLEVADQLGYEHEQGQARPQPRRLDASASASRTSSTRSAARSTTRSSATVGAWSTRSIGAYRSSCPIGRRRSPRTSSGWPSRSSGERVLGRRRGRPQGRPQKKSLFSWR